LGFSNRVLRTRFNPQRLGRFAPLSLTAYGGKIQAPASRVVVDSNFLPARSVNQIAELESKGLVQVGVSDGCFNSYAEKLAISASLHIE
jgi:hypothetical protein